MANRSRSKITHGSALHIQIQDHTYFALHMFLIALDHKFTHVLHHCTWSSSSSSSYPKGYKQEAESLSLHSLDPVSICTWRISWIFKMKAKNKWERSHNPMSKQHNRNPKTKSPKCACRERGERERERELETKTVSKVQQNTQNFQTQDLHCY